MNKSTVNITHELDNEEKPIKVIYISSYIPRKCGIATFTKDLTTAINNQNPHALAEIIAVTDDGQNYEYPWEVKLRIHQNNPQDYYLAAHYINQSSADVINLQHEFGLFGGVDGDYILPMLDLINKPIITNFHTLLPNPDEHKRYIIKRIIDKSSAVIAMTQNTRKILTETYGCEPEKTTVIQHGVPDFSFNHHEEYKKMLKIKSKFAILLQGLLSPGKGIEYVIDAMPEILKADPNVQLIIAGQTHPVLLRNEGESYRSILEQKVARLKIKKNVSFINKYFSLDELIKYHKAADIFITPHLDPQQPMSGTLSYALGAGNVCISTPYNYAIEVLANDVGLFVDFKDPKSIAEQVIKVVTDASLMLKYKTTAYRKGRLMTWPNIAKRYLNLAKLIVTKYEQHLATQVDTPSGNNGSIWHMATS